MSRPRILHIGKFYPPHKGGMEIHLQELCRPLTDDFDVNVIVANSRRRNQVEDDGKVRVCRLGNVASVASSAICPSMIAEIRRTTADIVHLHLPNPTAVLAYLAACHPGRLIVTHHSDVIRQQLLRSLFTPILEFLLRRADAIISFSPNHVNWSRELRFHHDRCHVIPHGLDPVPYEKPDHNLVDSIRARYGRDIVLAVGRLVYYKGFEYLIEAAAGTKATLLIIGTGPQRERLVKLAGLSRAANHIHFLGEVADVVPYYHAARIFVLPSIAESEAFGIVQLEAMACGTPVINTHLPSGVPFVSLHGQTGLTVPPADADALRQAITALLKDDHLHTRLSKGARQRLNEQFTVARMVDRTGQLYEHVLGRSERRERQVTMRPHLAS